jgi:stress-induced-phosphoprotein 1
MDTLKTKANTFYIHGDYEEAVKIYTEILESERNYNILSNRAAAYIKLEKYEQALEDAIESTKINPDCAKSWGRIGAALYGLERYNDATIAYDKAYDLENKKNDKKAKIYLDMINEIRNIRINKEEETEEEEEENNERDKLFNSVITDTNIMEKLNNSSFQNKILSLQEKPLEAVNDPEVLNVLLKLMNKL